MASVSLQARIIHNTNPEWGQIKEAAEKAREAAVSEKDELGEVTCSELLEALELSRCIFLMKCAHSILNISCWSIACILQLKKSSFLLLYLVHPLLFWIKLGTHEDYLSSRAEIAVALLVYRY